MKKLIVAAVLTPGIALAHDSLIPHDHPHSVSMLPDTTTLLAGALFLLGVYLGARWFFKE